MQHSYDGAVDLQCASRAGVKLSLPGWEAGGGLVDCYVSLHNARHETMVRDDIQPPSIVPTTMSTRTLADQYLLHQALIINCMVTDLHTGWSDSTD